MQPNYTQYDRAVQQVARKLGLDKGLVDKIYRAYCRLIIEKLSELPLKKDLTEEQYSQLQTNVNLPSLGKLYCTWKSYTNHKKQMEYVQKAKENKAARNRRSGNNESI